MVKIHYSPQFRAYDNYGNVISLLTAPVIYIICLVLTFLLAFYTGNFYLKLNSFVEQPYLKFTQKGILMVHRETNENPLIWTTNDVANGIIPSDQFIFPEFRVETMEDTGLSRNIQFMRNSLTPNPDAKADIFKFKFRVPVSTNDNVQGIELLLFFQMELRQFKSLHMESAVHVSSQSSGSASGVTVMGNLRLKQRIPLNDFHRKDGFNHTSLELSNIRSLRELNIDSIYREFYEREISTLYRQDYTQWRKGKSNWFDIDVHVHVPEWVIHYRPNFWESIKFAYVQIIAIGIPIFFIGWLICQILYAGGILNTKLVTEKQKVL